MSENETSFYNLKDDVQQAFLFRDEVVQLVDSRDSSRAKIDIKHLIEFRDRVKEALDKSLVGERSLTDEDAIAYVQYLIIKQELANATPQYDPQEVPEVCDDSDYDIKDREIERLKRCISGIASFLDLPSDAKQPDICQAIMELKEKYKKLSREPLSNEQIIIADLRHDLRVANKVIARLVGE